MGARSVPRRVRPYRWRFLSMSTARTRGSPSKKRARKKRVAFCVPVVPPICSAVGGTGSMLLVTTRKKASRHRQPVDDGIALLHARRRAQAPLSRVNTSCRLPLQLLPTSRALPFTFSITSKHHANVFAKVTPAAHFVMWTSCRWLSIWKASVHRQ